MSALPLELSKVQEITSGRKKNQTIILSTPARGYSVWWNFRSYKQHKQVSIRRKTAKFLVG